MVWPSGQRLPGLRLDPPRQLAVMHALVRFSHIAVGSTFRLADLHPHVAPARGRSTTDSPLAPVRYDLAKLRAKALVDRLPRSRQYRLLPEGSRLAVLFLSLSERLYAPLTAGLVQPAGSDAPAPPEKLSQLDRLYHRVSEALDRLVSAVGLKAA